MQYNHDRYIVIIVVILSEIIIIIAKDPGFVSCHRRGLSLIYTHFTYIFGEVFILLLLLVVYFKITDYEGQYNNFSQIPLLKPAYTEDHVVILLGTVLAGQARNRG